MSAEIERKYLDVDFDQLVDRLKELRCHAEDAHYESNVILDTPEASLYAENKLLRLRKQEWPEKTLFFLTYKAPLRNFSKNLPNFATFCEKDFEAKSIKAREEMEMEIGSFDIALKVLENLGYTIWARYEKIRQTWHFQQKYASLSPRLQPLLEMDILPFTKVVEIEGEESFILQIEKVLGLDKFKKSSTNYHRLHQQWREQNSMPPQRDFVFDEQERTLWRKRLNLPD